MHIGDIFNEDLFIENTERVPKIYLHTYTADIWEVDSDIVDLRHLVNMSYRQLWDAGMCGWVCVSIFVCVCVYLCMYIDLF